MVYIYIAEEKIMQELIELVDKHKTLSDEIEKLEKQVSDKKNEDRELLEKTIPLVMLTNGLAAYEGLDGLKVSYDLKYRGSAAQARLDDIIEFLGKYKLASGFKKEIGIQIPYEANGSTDTDLLVKLKTFLEDNGVFFNEKSTIHHMTLEKVVNDLMELVVEEDKPKATELLKISDYYKTKIKENK